MSKLRKTFLQELAKVCDMEKQLLKALPKMAGAAEHEELKRTFERHLEDTEAQTERLDRVRDVLGTEIRGKKCPVMQSLLGEVDETIRQGEGDAALICIGQKIEHFEMAAYGALTTWARLLGEEDAADLLEETLDEERNADELLVEMADTVISVEI